MDDVLTKEERDWLADLLPAGGHAWKIINRLVAEVERKNDYATRMDALAEERLIEIVRLRARNEKLVAVAQAADEALQADGEHSHYVDELCERCRLRAALDALNHSEPPNSSVGEP